MKMGEIKIMHSFLKIYSILNHELDSEVDECLFLEPKMCVKCSLVLIDSLLSGLFKQLDLSDASTTSGVGTLSQESPFLLSDRPCPRTQDRDPFLPPVCPKHVLVTPGPRWPERLPRGTVILRCSLLGRSLTLSPRVRGQALLFCPLLDI